MMLAGPNMPTVHVLSSSISVGVRRGRNSRRAMAYGHDEVVAPQQIDVFVTEGDAAPRPPLA